MTKLSEHFTLEEFTHSSNAIRNNIDNTPDSSTKRNLEVLAYTFCHVDFESCCHFLGG